jgi:hypothetical protein
MLLIFFLYAFLSFLMTKLVHIKIHKIIKIWILSSER